MISIYPGNTNKASVSYGLKPVFPSKFSELSSYVCGQIWCPAIYNGNTRREDRFRVAVLVGLDFDDGMSLDAAVNNVFTDMRHIIGTTRNHQKPKGDKLPCDRFRVILQFEKPIKDIRLYKWNLNQLVKHHEADENARGASRLFFPCQDIVSMADGYLLDIEEPPRWFMDTAWKDDEFAACAKTGHVPFWLQRKLAQPVGEGNRNKSVYCMAKDLSKICHSKDFVWDQIRSSRVFKENLQDHEFIRGIESTINSIFRGGGG